MLHTLPPLVKALVVSRPSKTIKSPYVADIELEDGTKALCHTPALGCCGLVSPGRTIYVSKSKESSKTAYTAQISESKDDEGSYYIGLHPMISQHMASKLLNKISPNVTWKTEVKISEHTRLDFVGTFGNSNKKIYVEVKNAMISNKCDKKREERKAIFPDGFRKSKNDTISPRAVKHAETLAELMNDDDTIACYLVFIVPRNDCKSGLELNETDPTYCNAIKDALANGVKVLVFGLDFLPNGEIHFDKELVFHPPS